MISKRQIAPIAMRCLNLNKKFSITAETLQHMAWKDRSGRVSCCELLHLENYSYIRKQKTACRYLKWLARYNSKVTSQWYFHTTIYWDLNKRSKAFHYVPWTLRIYHIPCNKKDLGKRCPCCWDMNEKLSSHKSVDKFGNSGSVPILMQTAITGPHLPSIPLNSLECSNIT
jgi:hypothetical protein